MIRKLVFKVFGIGDTSQFGEQALIKEYFSKINADSDYVIDIGASDGVYASNTHPLFKAGNPGIAVEPDSKRFTKLAKEYQDFNVNLFRGYATQETVVDILKSANTPNHPLFMNFDIDSFDYFVLRAILKEYRPSLICAEINETMPPPIRFAVLPTSDVAYTPWSHFYGMSIEMLADLCREQSYDLIGLNYINAFIVPSENADLFDSLTAEEAYNQGYKNKPDRKKKFPWNADMECLQEMEPEESVQFIRSIFSNYDGKYFVSSQKLK